MQSFSAFFWWPIWAVGMMRPLGILLFMPIFNKANLGGSLIRNALVLLSILPIFPLLLNTSVPDPNRDILPYFILLFSELFIGLLIGFFSAFPFWIVDMAGFILDTVRGASIAAVFNPQLKEQSSPLGIFFSQVLVALFFVLSGFHILLSELYESYRYLPPGADWHWNTQLIPFLMAQWQLMWTLALTFAMPALVIMILLDLSMGLLNRSAQQLNVFFLSMPIKSAMGLFVLLITIGFSFSNMTNIFFTQKQNPIISHLFSSLSQKP